LLANETVPEGARCPVRRSYVDEDPEAEELILRVNKGRRKVPTIEVDGRYFACSPFDPEQLAEELKIPLNP
jgi:glutaredoxin